MIFENERLRVVGIGGTLRELDLPMYEPGRPLDEYGPRVRRFIEAMREADALIVSTAAYHGTLAGVTKNALDFAQFLARDERPYLDGRVVGLISTAGGERAAANTTDAMVHVAHALRGVVAPQMVTIGRTWQRSDAEGNITDEAYGKRLDRLGRLVVEVAEGLNPENRHVGAVL